MPADSSVSAAPLLIAINPGSGAADKEQARAEVERVLRAAQKPFEIHLPGRREPIGTLLRRLAAEAAAQRGVLVVGGGDGTLNAAVNVARDADVPLGILPLGTFNYLARAHGVPLEPAAAARVLVDGVERSVPMGEVNGRLFFNNASFGLYTGLIQRREEAKRRFGRRRLVATLASITSLLQGQRPFTIQTLVDGTPALRATTSVFVACNRYQLELLGLEAAACQDLGALAVVMLKPTHLGQRLRLLLRTALRQLDDEQRLASFCAETFEVRSARRTIAIVVDGETVTLASPLVFRWIPEAVRLLFPARGAAAPA